MFTRFVSINRPYKVYTSVYIKHILYIGIMVPNERMLIVVAHKLSV